VRPYIIAVDVGGTRIRSALANEDGTIFARFQSTNHAEQPPEIVLHEIVKSCREVLRQADVSFGAVRGIGLGFAGTVNGAEGVVLISSNLPAWNHFPLRQRLEEETGVPVLLENDSSLGALGEYTFGAGRGARTLCYVTFSTGFGLGIVLDGRLHSGASGTAGEISHVTVAVGGPPCTCGKRGCLMSYASGTGISRMAYDAIDRNPHSILAGKALPDRARIPAEEICECARAGDESARGIIETAGYYSGLGLSLIVQVLNPEKIILGGGLFRIGQDFLAPVMRGYRETVQPEIRKSTVFAPWTLQEDVTLLGAVALVLQNNDWM